jgi:hypothetical protein
MRVRSAGKTCISGSSSTYVKTGFARDFSLTYRQPQNIRVIASYYTQITLTRLTELLDLSPDAAERTLCKLVTDKTVKAKIDRPAGIVDFKQKQTADQTLNEWSGDLGKMLGLIEKTSHLINKVSLIGRMM